MTDIPEKKARKAGQKWDSAKSLDELAEKWPSPFVARERFEEFSSGLFKGSSLNRLDAVGKGINTRYRRGSKVFYEVIDAIEWLKSKERKKK
jgi:hypothetical protein